MFREVRGYLNAPLVYSGIHEGVAMARVVLGAKGFNDFFEAANRLRKFDKTLPAELRALLRKTARPLMRQQKRALMALPGDTRDSGEKSPVNLRAAIARGMRLRLRTGGGRHGLGPIYRIETKMGTKDLAMLPRGLDTEFDGWRSPYYGESPWVHHHVPGQLHGAGTAPSWFLGPAKDEKIQLREEIVALLKASAYEIAAKSGRARPGMNLRIPRLGLI